MPAEAFLIVRHGQTLWSANGRHTGVSELELTAAGDAESAALQRVLPALIGASKNVAIYVSPRIRARQTAQLALPPELAAQAVETDTLAEFDYGDYEGLTAAQIEQQRPGWDIFRDGCPHGENVAAVVARCDAFIALTQARTGCIVAFTHGHLSRILTAHLLGLDVAASAFLNDTASVAVIRERRGALVLQGWNLRGAQ